jgi:hypothetical protein
MYNIRSMTLGRPASATGFGAAACVLACFSIACGLTLGREYEYEEQLYLNVDGSAEVIVNASIPSLVVLRGLPLDPSPQARLDALALRQLYTSLGCEVDGIGSPWFRHGRRFVQVRLATSDIEQLSRCAPLGWSTYSFNRVEEAINFEQRVGAAASGDPGRVNWTGNEIVAFRMHVPSKVLFHNVRRMTDDAPGEIERGNILTWEQRLADRRAGKPIVMAVMMDPQSILYRTLWLFAGSFVAAMALLAGLIGWTIRKGKQQVRRVRPVRQVRGTPEQRSPTFLGEEEEGPR